MNKVLIIDYSNMRPGGIEVVFAYLMQYAMENDHRVIWITTEKDYEAASFQEILSDNRIEKCYWSKCQKMFFAPSIRLSEDESVVMLSCAPIDYVLSERLRMKYSANSFQHLLVLPNFTGNGCYPDRLFQLKWLKRYWFKKIKKWVYTWEKEGSLYAFALKHLDAYQDYYSISLQNKESCVFPRIKPTPKLNSETLFKKAQERKKCFTIITCARFEFPHKGYILGLIDAYSRLKCRFPELHLVIVGYGDGAEKVNEKIQSLDENTKHDIVQKGMLPYDQLLLEFQKAHLNVGVAGSLADGARCGVPSLVVRHYSYNCETYGFYKDHVNRNLDNQPGLPVDSFIESILSLTDDAYVEHSLEVQKVALSRKKYDPEYVFSQDRAFTKTSMSKRDLMAAISYKLLSNFKNSK